MNATSRPALDFGSLANRLRGDLHADALHRAMLATDGSIFSVTPAAVVYPRTAADVQQTVRFAADHGLPVHLDGARLWNAAVVLDRPLAELARVADTVSVCFSKGLGAPVGSLLCGSKDLIKEARRWRKMLGGGMRQAGILAAAGIIALRDHIDRLQEDHEHASFLAEKLSELDELIIDHTLVQTNMVFVGLRQGEAAALQAYLARLARLPGTPEVLLNIEPRCADGLDDARRATVYRILREAGTERAFTGKYEKNKAAGEDNTMNQFG